MKFPDAVVKRTLLHLKDKRDSNLISINVLEYLTVIIDYCATYVVLTLIGVNDDPHLVFLNMADNTSVHSSTNYKYKSPIIRKLLASFFLLMDYKLGSIQNG